MSNEVGGEAVADIAVLIDQMQRAVGSGPEIYRPGAFWDDLIKVNLEMINTEGIENFKRTIANNYYNWLVTTPRDRQIRHAFLRWARRPSLAPLMNHVEGSTGGLRTTNRERSFALSWSRRWRYKFFVGTIWETARQGDSRGLTERISEPEVGNPIRIRHRGRLISQDLGNSIIEWTFVSRSGVAENGCRIAELGAGYGRLAYVFAKASATVYCIFDVPPALAVAQWYLSAVLGRDRVRPYSPGKDFSLVERQLTPGIVAFFTPDQIDMFPDGWFDLTQTISTLPEMPSRQAAHYLEVLAAKSRRAVFLKQWRRWRNEADQADLLEKQYTLPAPWHLSERRIDLIQPAFFNHLWLRPQD